MILIALKLIQWWQYLSLTMPLSRREMFNPYKNIIGNLNPKAIIMCFRLTANSRISFQFRRIWIWLRKWELKQLRGTKLFLAVKLMESKFKWGICSNQCFLRVLLFTKMTDPPKEDILINTVNDWNIIQISSKLLANRKLIHVD